MELDENRIKKWDQASDDMIETRTIVSRMEPHLKELNGTVAEIKGQQLLMKGAIAATLSIVAIAGTVFGAIELAIRTGG